ncbi:MAG: hypothetical protein AAGE94_10170 [Acidobacteriota bacterium]
MPMPKHDTTSQHTPRPIHRQVTRASIVSLIVAVGIAGASELTVTAVQGDGLTVAVDVCVTHQETNAFRCEAAPEDGGGVRFTDLPAGPYVATLAGDPMWEGEPVEIEVAAEGDQSVTVELTTRIDFDTLSSRLGDFWRLRFDQTSGWGDGGTIEVVGYTSGKTVARWQPPRSTDPPIEIELTSTERDDFVAVLQRARLFDGGHVGTDTTPTDGPFDTLRMNNGGATAILVTSGNPTFAVGPRRELMQSLDALRRRLDSRR